MSHMGQSHERRERYPFEDKYHTHTYEHHTFRPGMWVKVSEAIRELHDLSLVAGHIVQVCSGTYLSVDDPELQQFLDVQEQARPRATLVPVRYGEKVWFVEEEYVSIAQPRIE